jgi:hypothetical protein
VFRREPFDFDANRFEGQVLKVHSSSDVQSGADISERKLLPAADNPAIVHGI